MTTLFEFIKEVSDDLYELASDIENLLYEQPNVTLMKCRLYCEELVKRVSKHEELEQVYPLKNMERIHKLYREQAMEEDIYLKLEWIRKKGNKAAHHVNAADVQDAIKAHKFLFDVSVWYMEVYVSYDFVAPIYKLPKRQASQPTLHVENIDQLVKPYLTQTMQKIDNLWAEMNQELEQMKKEKEEIEKAKIEKNNANRETVQQKAFPIIEYLEKEGLTYIDKRDKQGALWVIGDWSINEQLMPLKKQRIFFRYTKKGARSTDYQPAWFMLNKTLPMVEVSMEETQQKENRKQTKEESERQEPKQVELHHVPQTFWIQKGQILCPSFLEEQPLKVPASPAMEFLMKDMHVATYGDILEDVLRQVYMKSRQHFFEMMTELYVLGFRFTQKLAEFQSGPSLDVTAEKQIHVQLETATNHPIFSHRYKQRLLANQIKSLKDLDNMLLSTVAWILNEHTDTVIQLLTGQQVKAETKQQSGTELLKEKAEGQLDNDSDAPMNPVTPSPIENESEQGPVADEDTDPITLMFQNETFQIEEPNAMKPLVELGIEGCTHLLNRLKKNGIHCLKDFPPFLDGIHTTLKGVGQRTVYKFWEQLGELDGVTRVDQQETGEKIVRYSGEWVEITEDILETGLEPDLFPVGIRNTILTMKENGIHTFKDIPDDLLQLKKLPGIGKTKINNFLKALQASVKQQMEELQLNKLTDEERFDYEMNSYMSWYEKVQSTPKILKVDKISPVYIELVQMRYEASLNGEHLTLEQLGSKRGVTRERIRQILKKGDMQISRKWILISELIAEKLGQENGIILAKHLDSRKEAHYLLLHALEDLNIFYFYVEGFPVLTNKRKREFDQFVDVLKKDVKHIFHKQVITKESLHEFCQERSLEDQLPEDILYAVASSQINWLSENQGIIKNLTKADIVEMVMLQYPNGVEIYKNEAELISKANDLLPGGFEGERSFYSIVGRDTLQDTFLMWGRGEAIHRHFVKEDQEWLRSVIKLAASWLEKEEFIHIAKLYNHVKNEALERNIPNEYALYSLLRIQSQETCSFPRFPSVIPYGADRLENHEWIVRFMEEKNRPVTVEELVEEFVHNKGWKRFTLDFNLSSSTEIIPYEHGAYTLKSRYDEMDREKFQIICNKVNRTLAEKKLAYVPAVFEENKMFLKSIGIETAHVLYHLMREDSGSGATFPRYPYIVGEGFAGDSVVTAHIVEDYMKDADRIVAREEVNHWLEEWLGEGSRILDLTLINSKKILYYSRGQYGEYVHRDVIQMDEQMEREISDAIYHSYEKIKKNAGRDFVYRNEVFFPNELPELRQDIPWSEELLADILKKSGDWRMIGSYNEIFVPKRSTIKNEVNFMETILLQKFQGAVKLHELKAFLSDIRYSKNGNFLFEVNEAIENGEAPFVINGDEVLHRELEGII